jgi:hypothetical protein
MLLAKLNFVHGCSQHSNVTAGISWRSPGKMFSSLGVYLYHQSLQTVEWGKCTDTLCGVQMLVISAITQPNRLTEEC